jgi:phenylacetate-CoA ligase
MRKALWFALNRMRGHKVSRYYRVMLRQDEARSGGEIELERRLAHLLVHCVRHVPYYAERLIGGEPAARRDPFASLASLPLLSKDIIRAQFDRLCASDLKARGVYENTSGGSTGEPVRLLQDREYWAQALAVTALFSKWAGKDIGEREVRLWGSERDILAGGLGPWARLKNCISNTVVLNAFRMSDARMREYVERINRLQPALVVAYAQSAYELARFAQQSGLSIRPPGAVMTSAGTLYPFMRETIERVFGAPLFNRYGSREVGNIASQCSERRGLHVAPWGVYVEIVDADGRPVPAGAEGEIVVTSLINHAMPLLRYRIGDRGALASYACSCGRPGQVLEKVSGRNVDLFRTADGEQIDGEYFTHLLYFRNWVRRFQVVQTSYARVVYRILGNGPAPRAELEEITLKTRAVMGPRCRIDFDFVDDLPPAASGKWRYTICAIGKTE